MRPGPTGSRPTKTIEIVEVAFFAANAVLLAATPVTPIRRPLALEPAEGELTLKLQCVASLVGYRPV